MLINLFNSLNPNGKRVPVTVTVEKADLQNTNDGEVVYLISLHTGAKSISGGRIAPVYISNVLSSTIQSEISRSLSIIAAQINWLDLESDIYPPVISEAYPEDKENDVPITSNVSIKLTDPFPASFIDKQTLKLYANDIEVTSEVFLNEKENELTVTWIPKKVY